MEDFKCYIGVKMLGAIPMTKGDAFNIGKLTKGITSILDSERDEEGYLCYNGKDTCWKSKAEFEQSYYPIEDISKITKNDVDGFLIKGKGIKMGEKTTVLQDSTLTGFDMVASSPCVDPKNYNQEIGDEYARKKIIDNLWGHLGFVLQWARNGLKGNTITDVEFEGDDVFKEYRRKGNSQMRPYIEGEDMTGISVSDEDKKLDTLVGGYIARNPKNFNDQWYVAKKYFDDNLESV